MNNNKYPLNLFVCFGEGFLLFGTNISICLIRTHHSYAHIWFICRCRELPMRLLFVISITFSLIFYIFSVFSTSIHVFKFAKRQPQMKILVEHPKHPYEHKCTYNIHQRTHCTAALHSHPYSRRLRPSSGLCERIGCLETHAAPFLFAMIWIIYCHGKRGFILSFKGPLATKKIPL